MRSARRGFTLVEMVVALAASSIVVLAGTTLVLLTLRVQSQAYADVSRQDTARVALTMVQTLAEQGKLEADAVDANDDKINGILYTQDNGVYVGNGTLLMSNATLSIKVDDRLLTVTLTDIDNNYETYSTTVFCRNWPRQPGPYLLNKAEIFADFTLPEEVISARYELLETAVGQFGSKGEIKGETPETTFAQWYNTTWTPETNPAWCACFVSWCMVQVGYKKEQDGFPNVNEKWTELKNAGKTYNNNPTPGDLIFFNFSGDEGADHVGIVLRVEGGVIYTVEGNVGNKVDIRRYDTADMDPGIKILGYVTLNWADTEPDS